MVAGGDGEGSRTLLWQRGRRNVAQTCRLFDCSDTPKSRPDTRARVYAPSSSPACQGDVGGLSRRRCSNGSRAHSANPRLAAAQDGGRPWLSGLSVDRGNDDVDGHSSLGHHRRVDWRTSAGLWVEVRHGCSKSAGGDVSPAPRTGNPGWLSACKHPSKRRCRPLILTWRDHGIQAALESATHGFTRSPR
ncbi:hypothetical protein B0T18DRAFT_237525 [Schizothecium vesticola]|uniref:Uncharacterized protein n=1 Tax=Schizothecium vesticola TaxID=314040 RepID=A0AA40EHD2_9PEZI|nr:hypothetical protein B0T18DRAFT_237525 [Schizothecium vesticola]